MLCILELEFEYHLFHSSINTVSETAIVSMLRKVVTQKPIKVVEGARRVTWADLGMMAAGWQLHKLLCGCADC